MMLMGILYCSSNKEIRAKKFYELCQMELDPIISAADKEMHEALIKLVQIAYEMIINVYNITWKEGMPVAKKE